MPLKELKGKRTILWYKSRYRGRCLIHDNKTTDTPVCFSTENKRGSDSPAGCMFSDASDGVYFRVSLYTQRGTHWASLSLIPKELHSSVSTPDTSVLLYPQIQAVRQELRPWKGL